MAFTFVAATGNSDDTSGTTLDTTASINLSAGDVVVSWSKWEGASTTLSVAKNSGSPANTHTNGTQVNHSNGDLHGQMTYLLSASADGTATFRQTLGAARPYRRFIIAQFRPDSGETVSLDVQNTGAGNGAAPASGAITTTGTDEIVVGGYGEYLAATTASETINGVAATEPTGSPQSFASLWYRILTATFTGGTAAASISPSTGDWICNVIAIKSVAAAGGSVYTMTLLGTGL